MPSCYKNKRTIIQCVINVLHSCAKNKPFPNVSFSYLYTWRLPTQNKIRWKQVTIHLSSQNIFSLFLFILARTVHLNSLPRLSCCLQSTFLLKWIFEHRDIIPSLTWRQPNPFLVILSTLLNTKSFVSQNRVCCSFKYLKGPETWSGL